MWGGWGPGLVVGPAHLPARATPTLWLTTDNTDTDWDLVGPGWNTLSLSVSQGGREERKSTLGLVWLHFREQNRPEIVTILLPSLVSIIQLINRAVF